MPFLQPSREASDEDIASVGHRHISVGAREPQPRADLAGTAHAALHDLKGIAVGTVTLTQLPNGVLVHAELTGLPAGPHGFHIHAAGKCEPPFKTAGGHFNPANGHHGMMNMGFHAGDLPNLYVSADGKVTADAFTTLVTLGSGDNSLFGKDGTSLVLHAGPDDYNRTPAGNSGDRIACGVVEK